MLGWGLAALGPPELRVPAGTAASPAPPFLSQPGPFPLGLEILRSVTQKQALVPVCSELLGWCGLELGLR